MHADRILLLLFVCCCFVVCLFVCLFVFGGLCVCVFFVVVVVFEDNVKTGRKKSANYSNYSSFAVCSRAVYVISLY